MLLAVPILAIVKIFCDRVDSLTQPGEFLVDQYFMQERLELHGGTRGTVDAEFTGTFDALRRGKIGQLFGTTTNITPQDILDGRILVIDIPNRRQVILSASGATALGIFEKSSEELSEFRSRVVQAEADDRAAVADQSLSEQEVVRRVGEAKLLQSVFRSRVAFRETEHAKLVAGLALEENYRLAKQEFDGLVSREIDRRNALIKSRMLDALDGEPGAETSTELNEIILRFSKAIGVINALRPNWYYSPPPGDGEYTAKEARALLTNLAAFEMEAEKNL